jgi:hypothetical protein
MNEYEKCLIEKRSHILNQPARDSVNVTLIGSQEKSLLIRNVKIYLDDLRQPTQTYPEMKDSDWVIVRNYEQFCEAVIKYGSEIVEISFDHDLGFEILPPKQTEKRLLPEKIRQKFNFHKEKTGYDCAKFLVEYCMDTGTELPEWKIHSMNPVGRKNIEGLLTGFERSKKSSISENEC